MGIVEFVTVILIVCKILTIGEIDKWSWFQVLIPEMIAISFYILIAIGSLLFIKKLWK